MLDLVIRGGDVVTPQGVGRWDVAVQGERIVAVCLPDPGTSAGRVIDATGKIVVPSREAIREGFPNLRVFGGEVPPPHPRRHPYRLDFGRIQLAMEKVAAHDGIMAVHAEDHDIVQFMYEKFREEKQTDGRLLPLVHNKLSELLAFRRTIQLAAATGAGVYFVHTSAKKRAWGSSSPKAWRSAGCRSSGSPRSPPPTPRGSWGSTPRRASSRRAATPTWSSSTRRSEKRSRARTFT